MSQVGKFNNLEVVNEVPFGFYLDAGDKGQILLPTKNAPLGCKLGDMVNAFIYHDSDDRLIATIRRPKVLVDHCAYLKVVSITKVGVFELFDPLPRESTDTNHNPIVSLDMHMF